MQPIDAPKAPIPVAGLPEPEQARILLQDYADAMGWGSELHQSREALIDFIDRLYGQEP